MRLENKVTIITGAGMGQGRAAALRFSQEGSKIAIGDVNVEAGKETARLVNEAGGEAVFAKCDVGKENDCRKLVEKAVKSFGKVDILYNNAGVLWKDRDKSVINTKSEDWDAVMAICLKGVYFMCKYAIPEMQKAGGGAIVNIGSISGLTGSTVPQDAYASAKGALIILTKSLAVQFAPDNIRANIIHPGMIDTPMQHKYMKSKAWVKAVQNAIPLGRFGRPEDIANAALYLASDEASFVTGAELIVDGGFIAT